MTHKVVGDSGRGWLGVVDARLAAAMLSGRGARVYTCTRVRDNIYRVDVYRSRLIDASLLTTSPQQGCLAPGQHTGAGWAW